MISCISPAGAIGVAECSVGAVALVIGGGSSDASARAVWLELRARRAGVEHLADLGPTGHELVTSSVDIGHDQVQVFGRTGAAEVILSPNWIDAGDPGGVYWTTLTPLSKEKASSSRHPGRS